MQITGELFDHLNCWDALRAALPVGTVSGAPKVTYLRLETFYSYLIIRYKFNFKIA